MRQLMWNVFVHMILRKFGPFALRIGEKTLSLVHIPFSVRFMRIVYIAYMGTVVLIVKISSDRSKAVLLSWFIFVIVRL